MARQATFKETPNEPWVEKEELTQKGILMHGRQGAPYQVRGSGNGYTHGLRPLWRAKSMGVCFDQSFNQAEIPLYVWGKV